MQADDLLGRTASREWAILLFGVMSSVLFHLAIAAGAAKIPPRSQRAPRWVEMVVTEVPVAPAPEPPKPEPPKSEPPKPEPRKTPTPTPVKLDEIPPSQPPPDAPPTRRPVRLAQGLSNSSFAPGTGGFVARSGNTTAVAATGKSAPDAGPFTTVPYTSVGTAPKIRANPPMEIPDDVVAAGVSGRVEMEVTVAETGRVIDAVVVGRLHPAADAACVRHVTQNVRFTPGTLDGAAVAVRGVPFSCRIEEGPN
jgi:outer membrane biosynthesis protein TonB